MNQTLESRKVLLVGGGGFIGHHLALDLRQQGATVMVFDNLSINHLAEVTARECEKRQTDLGMLRERLTLLEAAGVHLTRKDARDEDGISRWVDESRPDIVIHLAGVAHAGRCDRDPSSAFAHGLLTLQNALEASRGRVDHFVFVSSSMVYGNFPRDPVDESVETEPLGVYGALKLAGERLVRAYERVFGLSATIVRPSALYGPRCVSRRIVQAFVENAAEGLPLRIDGTGEERLDFTYVSDLVNGIRLVLLKPSSRGQTFNVTFGASRSALDLARVVRSHYPEVAIEFRARDPHSPRRGTLDIGRARTLLGYEPLICLEEGVARYIDWYMGRGRVASHAPNRELSHVAVH